MSLLHVVQAAKEAYVEVETSLRPHKRGNGPPRSHFFPLFLSALAGAVIVSSDFANLLMVYPS